MVSGSLGGTQVHIPVQWSEQASLEKVMRHERFLMSLFVADVPTALSGQENKIYNYLVSDFVIQILKFSFFIH